MSIQEPSQLNKTSIASGRVNTKWTTRDGDEPFCPPFLENRYLHQLTSENDPGKLEASMSIASGLLTELKTTIQEYSQLSSDAGHWLQTIAETEKLNTRTRTIIGVVGNTGAGKSSVINAMLDEEFLVPTNCMRACTAVVTELSWNDSSDIDEKYRAEIEFIQVDEWEKELEILYKEMLDLNGQVSREAYDEDTEAGIAYSKIMAVYPQLTKEGIARTTPQQLMNRIRERHILGTTKRVRDSSPTRFYKQLQRYVDSKEKDHKKKDKPMEFWPLIKVVRTYIKADALSTGAVVVDLPGVHDSNAARANVASGYMKQCTGLWIVAPINRAVDDKAAKSLLGQTFKRQLKYDGTYSNVTFICSKTDDISITEAIDSLNLDDSVGKSYEELDHLEEDLYSLEQHLSELKESRQVYAGIYEDEDIRQETWENLLEDLKDGHAVYAPRDKKRKRSSDSDSKKAKKTRVSDKDSDDSFGGSESSESEHSDDSDDEEDPGQPLDEVTLRNTIEEIKGNKIRARNEKNALTPKINGAKDEIKQLKKKIGDRKSQISSVCIAERNRYSKGAIQQDFAAGIKELDQENAIEEDEEHFNPDDDIRDYDAVASSLPVFCVSSRAYQKLSGRMKKDPDVAGFTDLEDTEIPRLKARCKMLTESGRAANCRAFLNNLNQLLLSLRLWSSNSGSGANMSEDQKNLERNFVKKQLRRLETRLEHVTRKCLQEMRSNLEQNIWDRAAKPVEEACNKANPTSERWGMLRNGGLYWATYKAVCRRDGVFHGSGGLHDFNQQLLDPLTRGLAGGWERVFQRRLPQLLSSYTKAAFHELSVFHDAIERRGREHGLGVAEIGTLRTQLKIHEALLSQLAQKIVALIQEHQRDANREFVPVIARAMQPAYRICTEINGTGSYKRMKSEMESHVDNQRHSMFMKATDAVKDRLDDMWRIAEQHMSKGAEEVFMLMQRDYLNVLGGVNPQDSAMLSKTERDFRRHVSNQIEGADKLFRDIVGGEPTPEPEQEADMPDWDETGPDTPVKNEAHVKPELGELARDLLHSPDAADNAMGEAASVIKSERPASQSQEPFSNSVEQTQLSEGVVDRNANMSTSGTADEVVPEHMDI
ncbi:hypothetical protein BDY21DRAFT_288795 [Lineolata rhizophorae]|uniref:P-loop containing nucleoside triphosphate hydrolase protein n=1 Tax=Lineolata rhizophorae TaxID=578093 RepID=A0A6A6NWC6_9PEZI|nr:hypothetical protein BDY21DRAFT_288795 [Lineolata rhizophorae]